MRLPRLSDDKMEKIHYDGERIGMLLSDIKKYSDDLEAMNIRTAEDLYDKRNFYAVSMILFSLLNRVFDLGSEVVMAQNLGIPTTYREIFTRLQKKGLISNELTKEMTGMVTYRNLLSHEYHGITEEKLFTLVKNVGHIRTFVQKMQEYIRNGK
jgi:uncharacterized protein YutE (UPF0331/DUF86 family)